MIKWRFSENAILKSAIVKRTREKKVTVENASEKKAIKKKYFNDFAIADRVLNNGV